MSRGPSIKSLALCLFFVLQIIAPMTMADDSIAPDTTISNSHQIESLEKIGIHPSGELINGWFLLVFLKLGLKF